MKKKTDSCAITIGNSNPESKKIPWLMERKRVFQVRLDFFAAFLKFSTHLKIEVEHWQPRNLYTYTCVHLVSNNYNSTPSKRKLSHSPDGMVQMNVESAVLVIQIGKLLVSHHRGYKSDLSGLFFFGATTLRIEECTRPLRWFNSVPSNINFAR